MHDAFAVIRWSAAGISPALVSFLWSESVAAEVLVFFVIGPALVTRLTPAGAAAIAALGGVLRWAVMAQTTEVRALALVQPLHGMGERLVCRSLSVNFGSKKSPTVQSRSRTKPGADTAPQLPLLPTASPRL
jgi:MFS transporter, PPP family, 3-phenylpropionic acid transporter